MTLENQSLILDMIEWISQGPRPYSEVMAAWRTSCPRLTIWEDAVDAGLVARGSDTQGSAIVRITPAGLAFLTLYRSPAQAARMAG